MLKQELRSLFAEYDPSFRLQNRLMEGYNYDRGHNCINDAGISYEMIQHHGGEDEGSEYWAIYKFSKGQETVFIKFNGYYQSFCDTEYLGFDFVVPTEVMVIQYLKDESND